MTMVVAGDAVAAGVAAAATTRAALAYSAAAMPDSRYKSPPDTLSGCLGCRRQHLALLLYGDCTVLPAWVALPKQRQGCSS